MVPTDSPAGTIATVAAGVVEFRATLMWDEKVPPEPTLTTTLPGTVRCPVVERDDPRAVRREISCEVRALSEEDLARTLEALLRSVTVAAAVSDAVLETQVVRLAPPKPTRARTLETLALDLWGAGFPVRFAPSWTPVRDGGVPLGVHGAEKSLREFLSGHPCWTIL